MTIAKNILDVNSLQLQVRNNYLKLIYPYVALRIKVTFSLWSGLLIIFLAHCGMTIPNLINDNYKTHILLFPFWGYLTAQIPGYFLATKYNPNKLFGGAIVTSSLLYLFIPVTLTYVPHLAIAIRFLQGLIEGVAITSCYSIWITWCPPAERTTVAPLAFSGCYAGFMLGMPFCQYFAESVSWKYPFFYVAFMGILWYAFWRPSIFEKPNEEEFKDDELRLLYNIDWQTCSMFLPTWVICISCFCLLLIFQAYSLTDHSSMAIEMSILFGLVPNLTMAIPLENLITTYFKKPGQVFNSQRIFYSVVIGVEAILLLITIVVKHVRISTTALTLGMFFSGSIMSGFYFNNLSVVPKFASLLIGLSTIVRNLACFLVIQYHNGHDTEKLLGQWRIVFILLATLYLSMVIIYTISVNNVKRSWTYSKLDEENSHIDDMEEKIDEKKTIVYMIHI